MRHIAITEHQLTDHSGFRGSHSFSLSPSKPTLVLGINGSGKTSLLNSIYSSVIVALARLEQLTPEAIDISRHSIALGKSQSKSFSAFKIEESGTEQKYQSGITTFINGTHEPTFGPSLDLQKKITATFEDTNACLPVFRYFRTEKLIEKGNAIVQSHAYNKNENRLSGYKNHFIAQLSIQEVTSFIIDQINNENQEKIEKRDFNYETPKASYIRKTMNTFFNCLYGENINISVGETKFSNGQSLVLKKGNDQLEFSQLSSGEKYVIALVSELIYRNVVLNPSSKNFSATPGIVLIDEIEDHLHPRWQLTILNALTTSFPNFQFIVSSHSPLVASSVRNEQIIALSNFEIIPSDELPDVYSGTADELLNKILFSDNQIKIFVEERKEIDSLIASFNFNEAEQKLNKLKKQISASPKWVLDYERKINFGKQ